MSLRRTPFYRALHRPNLILGGEREPVLITLLVAGALVIAGQNVISLAVAAVLWFAGLALLRQVAKADPRMLWVYWRHLGHRGYYPPRSRPFRDAPDRRKETWTIVVLALLVLLLVYRYCWR